MDDSQAVRTIVRRLSQEFSLEIMEAGDGLEGLDRLNAAGPPELIIVDWKMPRMDGREFVKILRANPVYNHTYILMFTSESGVNQMCDALQWGADDYLAKPCTAKVIREKLESVILQIATGAKRS